MGPRRQPRGWDWDPELSAADRAERDELRTIVTAKRDELDRAGSVSPRKQYGGVYALTEDLMWWEVKDTSGRELGCLVLDGHPDKSDGDMVLVSQAHPCGEHQPLVRPVGHTTVQAP